MYLLYNFCDRLTKESTIYSKDMNINNTKFYYYFLKKKILRLTLAWQVKRLSI